MMQKCYSEDFFVIRNEYMYMVDMEKGTNSIVTQQDLVDEYSVLMNKLVLRVEQKYVFAGGKCQSVSSWIRMVIRGE